MMAVLIRRLVWDGDAYDLLKALSLLTHCMSKVICHTFVLVAPTKAHGESDT